MKLTRDQVKLVAKKEFHLNLKGKTAVFVDWANVYGWRKSLQREVDQKKLYKYLKQYQQAEEINFYFGIDKHPKSREFLNEIKNIGFSVVSKEVKYVPISLDESHFKNLFQEIKNSLDSIKNLKVKDVEEILQILSRSVLRRKCDFDMEICIDAHDALKGDFESFLFFSGDGDFAPLYKFLISQHKQVIVIFAHGHMGREVYQVKRGIYTKAIDKLGVDVFVDKNTPPISRGA